MIKLIISYYKDKTKSMFYRLKYPILVSKINSNIQVYYLKRLNFASVKYIYVSVPRRGSTVVGKYEYPIVFECNKVYCIDWLYFVGNMKELLNYFELMD